MSVNIPNICLHNIIINKGEHKLINPRLRTTCVGNVLFFNYINTVTECEELIGNN